jgi:hypothetical protein
MEATIVLGVYRRLDNRLEGLSDNSEKAVELHKLRSEALHEVLDNQEVAKVINWGDTNDINPHEYVEIILSAISTALVQPFVIKGLKELGKKLADKAIDETTTEFVKWIISKLIKKQEKQKILDFNIRLEDGTYFRIDPPEGTSEITIHFNDNKISTIKYQLQKE